MPTRARQSCTDNELLKANAERLSQSLHGRRVDILRDAAPEPTILSARHSVVNWAHYPVSFVPGHISLINALADGVINPEDGVSHTQLGVVLRASRAGETSHATTCFELLPRWQLDTRPAYRFKPPQYTCFTGAPNTFFKLFFIQPRGAAHS